MKKTVILAINTGSTSTKIAVFHDMEPLLLETIRHPQADFENVQSVMDQYSLREKAILDVLRINHIDLTSLDAVVGRGGLMHPLAGGTYMISDLMLEHLRETGTHASNLSCIIAKEIADRCGVCAYTVDPVVVDEMDDIAKYTGCKDIKRYCIWHALNQKAVAKMYAQKHGTAYEDINLIVAHIGGGCTIGAHSKGRVIDVTNALSGEGPFTAERAGKLPSEAVVDLCFSGKYNSAYEIKQELISKTGLISHLGTNDGRVVREMIRQGDTGAEKVYKAMAYQIAKEIGSVAVVLKGNIDAIILTGGFAFDEMLMGWIADYTSFLAPITIFPGEDEMPALVSGVLRVLDGTDKAKEYIG